MILVDSSVWIDYLNGNRTPHTETLDHLICEGRAAIGDLIFLEILQGIRDDREYQMTRRSLATLDILELFGRGMPEKCAENYRALRKKGITIRKTADVIIATFCIEHSLPLLFSDRDFFPFADHLGLIAANAET